MGLFTVYQSYENYHSKDFIKNTALSRIEAVFKAAVAQTVDQVISKHSSVPRVSTIYSFR